MTTASSKAQASTDVSAQASADVSAQASAAVSALEIANRSDDALGFTTHEKADTIWAHATVPG